MSTEIPSGSDSNSFDAIRSSLVAAWVVILIMILKTPSKTGLDFFLLFLAIVNLGPMLIGAVPKHRSVRPESLPPLSYRCQEAALDPSRKIEAIKIYREETGLGLRDAKAAVEEFIAKAPRF